TSETSDMKEDLPMYIVGADEPQSVEERTEFYRAQLDQILEYRPLTRGERAIWSITDVERQLQIVSAKELRQAYERGWLPGATPGVGSRAMLVPWSSLVVHLGRLISRWYDHHPEAFDDPASSNELGKNAG